MGSANNFGHIPAVKIFPTYTVLDETEEALVQRFVRVALKAANDTNSALGTVKIYCDPQGEEHGYTSAIAMSPLCYVLSAHLDFLKAHKKSLNYLALHEYGHLYEDNFEILQLFREVSELSKPLYSLHTIIKTDHNKLCQAAIYNRGSVANANTLFQDINSHLIWLRQIIDKYHLGEITPQALADMANDQPEKWRQFKSECLEYDALRSMESKKYELRAILRDYYTTPRTSHPLERNNQSLDYNILSDGIFNAEGLRGFSERLSHGMEFICDEFAMRHLKDPSEGLSFMKKMKRDEDRAYPPESYQFMKDLIGLDPRHNSSHPVVEQRYERLQRIAHIVPSR